MNTYSIALFLHIVGSLGVSVALGLEWIGMAQIRKAKVSEEIPPVLGMVKSTSRLGFISMLATVLTGLFMVLTVLGWLPWIIVVLGALVMAIVISARLTIPRMAAIGRALAVEHGPVSQTLHNLVNQPILWASIQIRVAIVIGIVFLKIARPNLGGSLLTMLVAVVLGIASALPAFRQMRVKTGPAA